MRLSGFICSLLLLAPAQAEMSPSDRAADLNYVSTQIPRLDPYFFDHLDRGRFQRAAEELNGRLSTTSDAEFYVALTQLVAMAGDAHTQLNLPGSTALFPLQFRWLDDGVFVTAA